MKNLICPTCKINIKRKNGPYCIPCEIKHNHNFYLKHKKQINKDCKAYYYKNRQKFLEQVKSYQHQPSTINRDNAHYRKKYKEDINYKLYMNLSTLIYNSLKGNKRSNRTIKLLGCSINKFKKYIKQQFRPGMNWQNHSVHGWHLDHIKPRIRFDLSKPEEQQKCYHYTNYQPLWAKENWSKSDKFEV